MTTILELFNALVPYLMTFSFQVLWQIPEKIRLGQASEALPLSLQSKSRTLVSQL